MRLFVVAISKNYFEIVRDFVRDSQGWEIKAKSVKNASHLRCDNTYL